MFHSLFKNAFLLGISVSLFGCAFNDPPKERIIYQFVKVPGEFTERVMIPVPPDPTAYSVLPWDQKEDVLIRLIGQQQNIIGTCNRRFDAIDAWSDKNSLIYK